MAGPQRGMRISAVGYGSNKPAFPSVRRPGSKMIWIASSLVTKVKDKLGVFNLAIACDQSNFFCANITMPHAIPQSVVKKRKYRNRVSATFGYLDVSG